jgi:hypothetical protein
VRNLARAFTRAIPAACSGDPIWQSLPLGAAGSFDLTIAIDEDGHITSAVPSSAAVPPHLSRLAERTISLLRAGRFALSRTDATAGEETLRIGVVLSSVGAPAESDPSSTGPFDLGFEPPSPGHAGRAYFTLRSGRHVEVSVKIVERAGRRER